MADNSKYNKYKAIADFPSLSDYLQGPKLLANSHNNTTTCIVDGFDMVSKYLDFGITSEGQYHNFDSYIKHHSFNINSIIYKCPTQSYDVTDYEFVMFDTSHDGEVVRVEGSDYFSEYFDNYPQNPVNDYLSEYFGTSHDALDTYLTEYISEYISTHHIGVDSHYFLHNVSSLYDNMPNYYDLSDNTRIVLNVFDDGDNTWGPEYVTLGDLISYINNH